MAFVLEDGSGKDTANAYIDETYLDAYWLDTNVTLTGTTTLKQAAIVEATRYIERRFRKRFRGCIAVYGPPPQALSFPRENLWDFRGILIENNIVPKVIQDATAEYARRALTTPESLLPDPTDDPFVTKLRERVGPLETETERLPGLQVLKPYPSADYLISEFLYSGNYVIL
jgi:Putative DnaT-like ssDNA binding protein